MLQINNQQIRIGIVIPQYGLIGGAEAFVFEMTERLARFSDFQIHVFANRWRKGDAPVKFHKVPILPFPRWVRPLSFAGFARRRILPLHIDIVHSHERIFEMDIFTFHGIPHKTWIREARKKRMSLFDRTVARVEKKGICGEKQPLILPVSGLVRDELVKVYPIPEDRIQVAPPGVSLKRFSAIDRPKCRKEIRQRFDLTETDVVVLFVGMNFEIKRLDLLVRGLAEAVHSRSNRCRLKLLVVGRGDADRYRALAQELDISEHVVFAGVTREVETFYAGADIFAMPSAFDTFGLVVLEAMAAGLPVIISDKVGARDLIDSGYNGIVLPSSLTVSDMAAALQQLEHPEKRFRMGKAAEKTAAYYDWDRVAEQTADLYRRVAHEKNACGSTAAV